MRTLLYKVNNYFRALFSAIYLGKCTSLNKLRKEFTTSIMGDASIPNCKLCAQCGNLSQVSQFGIEEKKTIIFEIFSIFRKDKKYFNWF